MGLQLGLVGLPNVGKSTLFNAVTRAGAEAANFPFCTIDPNVGIVPLSDPRLERLAAIAGSARVIPTSLEVVDIAGLVAGASRGEGLGNQFLGHIRDVDAICHVVRCFEEADVVHVTGSVDPLRDVDVVETELALKDLETVDRRLERASRASKSGDRDLLAEREVLVALRSHLDQGRAARTFVWPGTAGRLARELSLLTAKPVLYAANVSEEDLPKGGPHVDALRERADARDAEVVVISARVEAELAELESDDRSEYLAGVGLDEAGLDRLVRRAYELLGLITFLTAGPKEARAWTIPAGTTAAAAAGEIHSDIERGFIRAEVTSFEDYDQLGGEVPARNAGRLRLEGKEYTVRDGDVIHFRFNV